MTTVKEINDIIEAAASRGEISRADMEGLYKQGIRNTTAYNRNREDYVPNQYAGLDYGIIAYNYILDHGGTTDEALEYAAMMLDKDPLWINEIKHNPYFYVDKVITQADDNPIQKKLFRSNLVERTYLSSSKTPHMLINRISRAVALYQMVNEKNLQIDSLQAIVDELRIQTASNEYRIKHLEEVVNIPDNYKEQAFFLRDKGFTHQQIADQVGKSLSTIKRLFR